MSGSCFQFVTLSIDICARCQRQLNKSLRCRFKPAVLQALTILHYSVGSWLDKCRWCEKRVEGMLA